MNISPALPAAARPAPRPPEAAAPLQLQWECVESDAALAALGPAWEALWRRTPTATPFQSPHWLLPWWRHVGQGRLATLALREPAQGQLVGLAPLYIYTQPDTGRRHLFPLGVATSDEHEPLVQPGWESPVRAGLLRALAARAGDWDVLEVPQLRAGSLWLQGLWPPGWNEQLLPDEPHRVLSLAGASGTELPPKLRQNLRTSRNRAARAGTLQAHRAKGDTVDFWLDALVQLHARRWATRGEPGVLHDPAVRAWHAEAAPRLQAAGLLRLWGLTLDGEPIAVVYGLADGEQAPRKRCYFYLCGFDPAQAALSPGSLIFAHGVEQARAEGAIAADFLRGRERYKDFWGACEQPMARLQVGRG